MSDVKGTRHRVCGREDLDVGEARLVSVSGNDICLVRCQDAYRAVDDICSHEDYSLAEGDVDGQECTVECWKHGSLFSLVTGEPLTLPATRPVGTYEVIVEGDDVFVVIP